LPRTRVERAESLKTLGLTGGIGMGKSAVGDAFRRRGVGVIDTDAIARQLVEPGQPALAEIRRQFGTPMLDANGRLRRDELARKVFADLDARRRLEAILHPRIQEVWQGELESWRRDGRDLAVVIIPLLFETHAAPSFDATLCVACSVATQGARLRARGWNAEEIQQRLAAQLTLSRKMELADYVLWNEAGWEVLEWQVDRLLASFA
jgi:dephospho-CoA kinase